MTRDYLENKLTPEIDAQLKQGTKVKFKWHGNNDLEYIGRIELKNDGKYFVPEIYYNEQGFLLESMLYYNPLESFFLFTEFEILN